MPVILALISDLMFIAKIVDAAKKIGAQVVFVEDAERAKEKLNDRPALFILDLNLSAAEPLPLAGLATAAGIPTLGFLSHVQVELKRKAEEAGCARVVPRSMFSQRLPELIAESLA